MNVADQIRLEKLSVSMLIAAIFGPGSVTAKIVSKQLEIALSDQITYDYRSEDPITLKGYWNSSPSLELESEKTSNLLPEVDSFAGLIESTYAFKLLTMSHILVCVQQGIGDADKYQMALTELGLGSLEVINYAKDFVA